MVSGIEGRLNKIKTCYTTLHSPSQISIHPGCTADVEHVIPMSSFLHQDVNRGNTMLFPSYAEFEIPTIVIYKAFLPSLIYWSWKSSLMTFAKCFEASFHRLLCGSPDAFLVSSPQRAQAVCVLFETTKASHAANSPESPTLSLIFHDCGAIATALHRTGELGIQYVRAWEDAGRKKMPVPICFLTCSPSLLMKQPKNLRPHR